MGRLRRPATTGSRLRPGPQHRIFSISYEVDGRRRVRWWFTTFVGPSGLSLDSFPRQSPDPTPYRSSRCNFIGRLRVAPLATPLLQFFSRRRTGPNNGRGRRRPRHGLLGFDLCDNSTLSFGEHGADAFVLFGNRRRHLRHVAAHGRCRPRSRSRRDVPIGGDAAQAPSR